MERISVVVPVYRAVETLDTLVAQISALDTVQVNEVIFVFDCGNTKSWTKIKSLVASHPKVIGVRLNRNYGQHNATICGFEYATGDYIVTMDEDLQHNPQYIPQMLERMARCDSDVVYAAYEDKKHSFFRNFTSTVLKKMLKYGIPELHKDYSSFRMIRTDIARQTIGMKNSYTFLDGYLTWITTAVSSITIDHSASGAGASSYTLKKLIEHSINIFVTFSTLPIRLFTYTSITFFILSSIYSLYIIVNSILFDSYSSGFPTIVVLLGFGFGFVLLGIGIIGEYIQKINLKTTNRPNYTVKEITAYENSVQ